MSPVEALKLALGEEMKAIELYKKLGLEHPSINDTCTLLIGEEQKHKKIIEKKISELTRY